jgi:protein CpxP
MRPNKFLLLILVLACAIPILSAAQPGADRPGPLPGPAGAPPGLPPGPGGRRPGPPPLPPPFMIALRAANLTREQQNKLHEIIDASRSETELTMRQLHSLHQQIADKLLSPGVVTETDLEPLAQQAAQVDQRMQLQWLRTALSIRAILTADQIMQMHKFNQQMIAINGQIESLMRGSRPRGGVPPAQ